MRKILLLLALMLIVLPLTGCLGAETVTAPQGAIPLADMPPAPEGLMHPDPYRLEAVSVSENGSLFSDGTFTMFIRYAIAPNASAVINTAIADGIGSFAGQYIEGVADDVEITTFSFFGQNAFMISAILTEDTEHGRAGNAAVYVIAPYGDYFVMVSAYAPVSERAALLTDVPVFMNGFTVSD